MRIDSKDHLKVALWKMYFMRLCVQEDKQKKISHGKIQAEEEAERRKKAIWKDLFGKK